MCLLHARGLYFWVVISSHIFFIYNNKTTNAEQDSFEDEHVLITKLRL